MEKKKNPLLFKILIFIMIIWGLLLLKNYFDSGKIKLLPTVKTKAIVAEVFDNYLLCYGGKCGLCKASIENANNLEFAPGQEILIYYNGMIDTSYPASYNGVKKIKILEESSNTDAPDYVLDYIYRNTKKITVTRDEMTRDIIVITVKDKNDVPYDIDKNRVSSSVNPNNSFQIKKLNSNEVYSGEGTSEIFVTEDGTNYRATYGWENIFEQVTER